MIITAHRSDSAQYSLLFDQMYKLRARTFADRRGWRVHVAQGLEIDHYDELDPLYLMSVSSSGALLASLRLLQTTGPHMLVDVFPETMSGAPIVRHPLIWESSRFCVDTEVVLRTASTGVHAATAEILLGLFEVAQKNGILNIVSVYDVYVERILNRVGCTFDRLGEPFIYDGLKTVAGVAAASSATINSIRHKSNITRDIFTQHYQEELTQTSSRAS